MTQEQRVLSALKIAGDKGINSYTAREELHIIQLPARVWGLKAKGHLITERTNPDKSVTYFLVKEKPRVKQQEQTHSFQEDEYVIVGNTFVHKSNLRQEALL